MKLYKAFSWTYYTLCHSFFAVVFTIIGVGKLGDLFNADCLDYCAAVLSVVWVILIAIRQYEKNNFSNLSFIKRLRIEIMDKAGKEKISYAINAIENCKDYCKGKEDYKYEGMIAELKADLAIINIYGIVGTVVSLLGVMLDWHELFSCVLLFVIIIALLFVIVLTLKLIKEETYVLSVLEGLKEK